MLFVHLTDVRYVARIRKHGLRMAGRGDRKGIYCVPLMEIEQVREMSEHVSLPEWDVRWWNEATTVRSTLRLWRWLMRQQRYTRSVAIVFKVPTRIWPAELFLHFPREDPFLGQFLTWCDRRRVPLIHRRYGYIVEDVRTRFTHGTCHLQINGEGHLGQVLSGFLHTGNRQWIDGLHDPFEVVFHQPIPSKFIHRILPFSQRNVDFRLRKSSGEPWA